MIALTAEMAKNLSIAVLLVVLVLGVLAMKVMRSVSQKAITLLLAAGLALGVWTQRVNVGDCADQVKAQAQAGGAPDATCNFFGRAVNVKVP